MTVAMAFLLAMAVIGLYYSFASKRAYLISLAGATVITFAYLASYGLMQ